MGLTLEMIPFLFAPTITPIVPVIDIPRCLAILLAFKSSSMIVEFGSSRASAIALASPASTCSSSICWRNPSDAAAMVIHSGMRLPYSITISLVVMIIPKDFSRISSSPILERMIKQLVSDTTALRILHISFNI